MQNPSVLVVAYYGDPVMDGAESLDYSLNSPEIVAAMSTPHWPSDEDLDDIDDELYDERSY
jgi:hypothetical protein